MSFIQLYCYLHSPFADLTPQPRIIFKSTRRERRCPAENFKMLIDVLPDRMELLSSLPPAEVLAL